MASLLYRIPSGVQTGSCKHELSSRIYVPLRADKIDFELM